MCAIEASHQPGGLFFFLVLGLFLFFQQKIIEIFTACDDE